MFINISPGQYRVWQLKCTCFSSQTDNHSASDSPPKTGTKKRKFTESTSVTARKFTEEMVSEAASTETNRHFTEKLHGTASHGELEDSDLYHA